jgi:DNA-binding NarL/FixJ family response regulator
MTQPSAKLNKPAKEHRPTDGASKQPIKVALVEDQPKVRESWTKLINSFPDFTCICSCGTGEEAVRMLPQNQPDVVLMDIFLPRMSGIECTVRLKELLPQTQIIILTAMADQELVFLALEAGADGYLLKRTKPADLRMALLDVLGGGAPMSSQIARRVIESFRQKNTIKDESTRLTIREEQILLLLSQGYSNKVIADKLELSIDTVCSHLKRVFNKLHVSSRTEAVIRYMASKTPHTKSGPAA